MHQRPFCNKTCAKFVRGFQFSPLAVVRYCMYDFLTSPLLLTWPQTTINMIWQNASKSNRHSNSLLGQISPFGKS
ncbi:hypothetical protein LshimejAT787_1401890 [Lyophyllum shimeji]|uniref:Uncharacterized protein n=1 Tax=Lyophyllum shimeji TaxID=47721 RepID=A0A9P3USZ4_LYOSH|nr:hypothetical protein LshimejAT787_1401890 [Lyophyllum shimeji]